MGTEPKPDPGAAPGRWWLPHFDKLDHDNKRRMALLEQEIVRRSKELGGTPPPNTHVLLEAALLVVAEDLEELERENWALAARVEKLERVARKVQA